MALVDALDSLNRLVGQSGSNSKRNGLASSSGQSAASSSCTSSPNDSARPDALPTIIFEALPDSRRRKVIELLTIAPTRTLHVDDIASHIAQLEHSAPALLNSFSVGSETSDSSHRLSSIRFETIRSAHRKT